MTLPNTSNFYRWVIAILFACLTFLGGFSVGSLSPRSIMANMRERIVMLEDKTTTMDKALEDIKTKMDKQHEMLIDCSRGIANIIGRMDTISEYNRKKN